MDNNLIVQRELLQTTSTRGWYYVVEIAEAVVKAAERKAIDEDDDAKGTVLRRKAQAAREFMNTLLQTIESAKQADEVNADDFMEVASD